MNADRLTPEQLERRNALLTWAVNVLDVGGLHGEAILELDAERAALVAQVGTLQGLLARVEPELAPGHDAASALSTKFGLTPSAPLIDEIRAALAGSAPPARSGTVTSKSVDERCAELLAAGLTLDVRAENAPPAATEPETLREALEDAHDRLSTIFESSDPEAMTQEAWFGMADVDKALRAASPTPECGCTDTVADARCPTHGVLAMLKAAEAAVPPQEPEA